MYSKILIVGNLGGDPETRFLPDGTQVTNMSVASNRKWTTQSGEQGEETTWYRVAAWGRLAEVCADFGEKGSKVFVEGRIKPDEDGNPRIWTSSSGEPRASYEVTAQRVLFLGTREEEESEIPF